MIFPISAQSLLPCLVFAMAFVLPANAIAQHSSDLPDRALDAATRNTVIDALLKKIDRVYIFSDVAKKMEQAIRAWQAKKEYDAITSGQEFAKVLTNHVKPDVAVPADQALLTAHLLALKKALKRHGDDRDLAESVKHTISEKDAELATLKAKPVQP